MRFSGGVVSLSGGRRLAGRVKGALPILLQQCVCPGARGELPVMFCLISVAGIVITEFADSGLMRDTFFRRHELPAARVLLAGTPGAARQGCIRSQAEQGAAADDPERGLYYSDSRAVYPQNGMSSSKLPKLFSGGGAGEYEEEEACGRVATPADAAAAAGRSRG